MAQVSRHRQRGETLILTLGILVVLLLGFVYVSRHIMYDAVMAGNNLTRQKNVQVADVAMRNLEQLIFNVYADQPLEQTGVAQPWYRVVPANTSIPDGYWNSCLGASAANRCGSVPVTVNGTALPYTAQVVVQTTGRQPDPYACNLQNFSAYYYDVYIHTVEASGVTSATTETVYKLCVFDPNSNH